MKFISSLRWLTILITAMLLVFRGPAQGSMALPRSTPEAQGISSKAREMNAIWDNLLPACGAEAFPEDAASQEKLKASIANLVSHPDKKGN